jgi:hypothetical protein
MSSEFFALEFLQERCQCGAYDRRSFADPIVSADVARFTKPAF